MAKLEKLQALDMGEVDPATLEGTSTQLVDGDLHLDTLQGRDYHHIVEAAFKACGRALRAATRLDGTKTLASTKEMLDV